MSNTNQREKAIMYIAVPVQEQSRYCDVPPVGSLFVSCQREAIKRKVVETEADIVGEFVIPKPSNKATDPLFRRMVDTIKREAIDYVLIYPNRPHRIREQNKKIIDVINAAGAQLVSVNGGLVTGLDLVDFMLHCFGDLDKFNRCETRSSERRGCGRNARRTPPSSTT